MPKGSGAKPPRLCTKPVAAIGRSGGGSCHWPCPAPTAAQTCWPRWCKRRRRGATDHFGSMTRPSHRTRGPVANPTHNTTNVERQSQVSHARQDWTGIQDYCVALLPKTDETTSGEPGPALPFNLGDGVFVDRHPWRSRSVSVSWGRCRRWGSRRSRMHWCRWPGQRH